MSRARHIAIAVVAILTLILVLQNLEVVETNILFFKVSMPRAFLLAFTALAGFVVGMLVALKQR